MDPATSPRIKLKSPGQDIVVNTKTTVTCTNVPEGLFDANTARKHFSKFGRVHKIRLFPKKNMCMVEYDQPSSVERAILNAGAFDGFMFDVTRSKRHSRRRSKKEDDPEWLPDSDVEEELSAMSAAPTYRTPRQKAMDVDATAHVVKNKPSVRTTKLTPTKKRLPVQVRKPTVVQPVFDPPPAVVAPTGLNTTEAAAELHQLRSRISLTPDEQWRTLDARDRILRAWGGAGARVRVGGATVGTCADMCPEKERLHRQAEHQVMTLETHAGSDGELDAARAVKQYSRSSADQEMPMCYELRPASVLARTCNYLLYEVADTQRQVTLADWFHFTWDRLRSIRKDITQQALCCAESIRLVEMCARFHAHCSARLADLEHTQFDQKLNTDNLTKCLQTLKHMYADVGPEQKPLEAEFRGYIALLNLGDANFWWEIKQLPVQMQKSEPITFAIKIFNALDNNNYVRFFRLIRDRATYLQACILLRYFNDVRARALARIVKAFAPRGGSRYPVEDLMNALAFESIESMQCFINHYGLRFSRRDDVEFSVILDRNQFIEDSDPFPMSRAVNLIESKRNCSTGEVIAGGPLPKPDYKSHILYTSFKKNGTLKETALIADDQGYDTLNDTNKDIKGLKAEVQRLLQGGRSLKKQVEENKMKLAKPETKTTGNILKIAAPKIDDISGDTPFIFKLPIVVSPMKIIEPLPGKDVVDKNMFTFSKPLECPSFSQIKSKTGNIFKPPPSKGLCSKSLLSKSTENKDTFKNAQNIFKGSKADDGNIFKKTMLHTENNQEDASKNLFSGVSNKNIFSQKEKDPSVFGTKNIFSKGKEEYVFSKPDAANVFVKSGNIFAKATSGHEVDSKSSANIFGTFNKTENFSQNNNLFSKPTNVDDRPKSLPNGDSEPNKLSPSSLFKSAVKPLNGSDEKTYSIFQSKNRSSVAENIFNSVNVQNASVYDFDQNKHEGDIQKLQLERINEEKFKEEERKRQEMLIKEEERRRELKWLEEERKRQEELRILDEKRKKEEARKQEELRKKIEEERNAELKRKAEEEERKFKAWVEKESKELIEELVNEINSESVQELITDEKEIYRKLTSDACDITEGIINEICNEINVSEMKAEKFLTNKLMKKGFSIWRNKCIANLKRRRVLDDTPVWLTERSPSEEALQLRRSIEDAALRNMKAIRRGYKFTGELQYLPAPEPYNVMEITTPSLLKRTKKIGYPYDKCIFWKVSLVTSGSMSWLYRKIELQKWLKNALGDTKKHVTSNSLIRVEKKSWNNLVDFAISVSLTNKENLHNCSEAIEGTNGLMFYATENDHNFIQSIQETLKCKHLYQVIPVAVVLPVTLNVAIQHSLESYLTKCVNDNIISAYKIFILEPENICNSLNANTKSALQWLAGKYPQSPLLHLDHLKSVCHKYLGNEIWCRLKSERDSRVKRVLKDMYKLIKCYNIAVDKLTDAITNENHFNYPTFPLEFKDCLDHTSPYPKPYEFIPSNVKTSNNVSHVKDIMKQLKLPDPVQEFRPKNVVNMQEQIRSYCKQIGWFEDPDQVMCKVVAVLPQQLSDVTMPCEQFTAFFELYDLDQYLNIVVCEKINRLNNFNNPFVIYEKSDLESYSNFNWLFDIDVVTNLKHKISHETDDIDRFIEAKRRRIAHDSLEHLTIQHNDYTLVEDNIKTTDECISKYNDYRESLKKLEKEVEEERKKSMELERMLEAALS